jgi:predicted oxidoreductase
MDLRFHNLTTDVIMALPQVVILEIKRDGLQPSPILKYLKELRIKSMGFSKYCLGSAFTNDYLKVNNVKPRLHKVAKLTQIITYNRSSYGNF